MNISIDTILNRVSRVIRLDAHVYRELLRDPSATREAAIVVAVVALAAGIGGASDSLGRVVFAIIGALVRWAVVSYLAYFFGKNIFGTPTTQVMPESMLRTLGYAQAPRILSVFGFIPVLGWIAAVAGSILAIIAAVKAIRETLLISTGRAILIAIISFVSSGIVLGILGMLAGVGWLY